MGGIHVAGVRISCSYIFQFEVGRSKMCIVEIFNLSLGARRSKITKFAEDVDLGAKPA